MTGRLVTLLVASIPFAWPGAAFAQAKVDADAAEALMKKSNCFKCHAVAREKDAPSYKEIANKYKSKADARAVLAKQMTTNPKVKVDGKEEDHENLKTKNEDDVKNVVEWVLSR